jgi:WD40 repeat protein
MKKLFLFLVVISAMWQVCAAEDLPDTVWTRDLWQLGSQINQVQFTPDGQEIAVAIGGGVYVFDIKTGQMVKQFKKFMFICSSFDFTEDGLKLITTSYETDYKRKIIVWNYLDEDTISIFNIIDLHPIRSLNNNTIFGIWNLPVWNLDSSKVCLYDLNIGKIIKNTLLTGQNSYIDAKAITISKELNLFAIITGNKLNKIQNVILGNLSTLEYTGTLGSHASQINDLSFSSDGKYLASASSDGIIKVWDVNEKKLIKTLQHLDMKDGYLQVKFSPNGGYLVSSGGINFDFYTTVWDLKNFTPVYKYSELIGASRAIDISQDSTKIALGRSYKLFLLNSKWTPTGIINPNDKITQYLYPNPTKAEITIPIEPGMIPKSLVITNSTGESKIIIERFDPDQADVKVNIGQLTSCIYFVSVVYPQKVVSFKFQVIR